MAAVGAVVCGWVVGGGVLPLYSRNKSRAQSSIWALARQFKKCEILNVKF
jgi:hypothetical protein